MFKKITGNNIPIYSWSNTIEEKAIEQAKNISKHPQAFHHIALMPDTHLGYSLPIGGVVALESCISPVFVGFDISCGMGAIKTNIKKEEMIDSKIKNIIGHIRNTVPVGFNRHNNSQEWDNFDFLENKYEWNIKEKRKIFKESLGTLGGGNHFIEIQYGDDGYIWLMIHSGSRNLGYSICEYYNKKAIELNKMWCSNIENNDLAFLPTDSIIGKEYIKCMEFAMDYAKENRSRIMEQFKIAVCAFFNKVDFLQEINIHHNFARLENYFGKNVWVHRKGATSARKDEYGIIPGSMGTSSYIVKGLGNPDSFYSCSHGAGRKMSRTDASILFTEKEANKSMEGIVYGRWNKIQRGKHKGKLDLGEVPISYKNIDEVINNQRDLIDPIVKLKPMGVIKG